MHNRLCNLFSLSLSYHPLLPAFRREDHSPSTPIPSAAAKKPPTPATPTSSTTTMGVQTDNKDVGEAIDSKELRLQSKGELTDVNLDLVHAFDIDFHHAVLPARPDLLLLPSNLKPFAKVSSE